MPLGDKEQGTESRCRSLHRWSYAISRLFGIGQIKYLGHSLHMADELQEIIFLDIETVPAFRTIEEMPEDLRTIWIESFGSKKSRKNPSKDPDPEVKEEKKDDCSYNYNEAGLYAEFGKIICISLGRFEGGTDDSHLKVHSLSAHNEKEILVQLSTIFEKYPAFKLCAHNGKGFDFPFLGRRFILNHLQLPLQLNILGKKPWEIPHLDTMELWSFGSRQSNVKLKLLCAAFGLPCPKDDIDGSMVRTVYYEQNDLPRIVRYCEKDVVSLAMVYKKIRGYY
jgi:3'-5' exonuclease